MIDYLMTTRLAEFLGLCPLPARSLPAVSVSFHTVGQCSNPLNVRRLVVDLLC